MFKLPKKWEKQLKSSGLETKILSVKLASVIF